LYKKCRTISISNPPENPFLAFPALKLTSPLILQTLKPVSFAISALHDFIFHPFSNRPIFQKPWNNLNRPIESQLLNGSDCCVHRPFGQQLSPDDVTIIWYHSDICSLSAEMWPFFDFEAWSLDFDRHIEHGVRRRSLGLCWCLMMWNHWLDDDFEALIGLWA